MNILSSHGEMLSQVDLKNQPHSAFDLSKHNYFTGKLGTLIPTRIEEVYPGDHIKGRIQSVVNFEPLAAPIMADMVLKQETFYVPYSIIWRFAHKFYTGKNGFKESMPQVCMFDIYRAVMGFKLILPIEYFHSYLYQHSLDFKAAMETVYAGLDSFGTQYGVYDLFNPLFELYHYWFDDVLPPDSYSSTFHSRFTEAYEIAQQSLNFEPWRQMVLEIFVALYNYWFGLSSLLDYSGFPVYEDWRSYFTMFVDDIDSPDPPVPSEAVFSSIPLTWLQMRALYVCWYWNYRDQLLETDAMDPESDEFLSSYVSSREIVVCILLRRRCWYKDTFTTALTNTGSGNLYVPVEMDGLQSGQRQFRYFDMQGQLMNTTDYHEALAQGASIASIEVGDLAYQIPMNYLTTARDATAGLNISTNAEYLSLDLFDRIRRLRTFIQKRLVLGYEYDDVLWSSFKVRLSNVRMRIPELLSRGRDSVSINTIINNTNIPDGQIAGDKTATAWANGTSSEIDKFIEEHGLLISFMTIMPIQSYSGGLPRRLLKKERYDMLWPEFATMGMDAVYNAELAAPRGDGSANGLTDAQALMVFGYQGRYYDLKSCQDEEHGRLRSDLNYLTFSREFSKDNPPKLNYEFVHCHPRLDMFVTDDPLEDVFRADSYSMLNFSRTLPVASEYIG